MACVRGLVVACLSVFLSVAGCDAAKPAPRRAPVEPTAPSEAERESPGPVAVEPPAEEQDSAVVACGLLEKKMRELALHDSHKATFLRFEPSFPKAAPATEAVYLVPFRGAHFPVPAVDYELQLGRTYDRFELKLLYRNSSDPKQIAIFNLGPMAGAESPITDLFSKAAFGGEISQPSGDASALLKDVFGREQITLFDILALGYTLTPSSYSCEPERLAQGIAEAHALMLKGVGSGPVHEHSVYRNVIFDDSILSFKVTRALRPGLQGMGEALLSFRQPEGDFQFSVFGTHEAFVRRAYALFGHIQRPLDPASGLEVKALPRELAVLAAFVEAPTPDAARKLLAETPLGPGKAGVSLRATLEQYLETAEGFTTVESIDAYSTKRLKGASRVFIKDKVSKLRQGRSSFEACAAPEAIRAGRALLLMGIASLSEREVALLLTLDRPQGCLYLDDLGVLPASLSKRLSELEVAALSLDGLTELDAATAKEITQFPGNTLSLGGVGSLDAATAEILMSWKGAHLFLGGVTELDVLTAQALSSWNGESLSLAGLRGLDAEVARKLLAGGSGKTLSLNGLASFDAATATELVAWKGARLELSGLRRLEPEAMKALQGFAGTLICSPKLGLENCRSEEDVEKSEGP